MLGSISCDQASMPPAKFATSEKPLSRKNRATRLLREPPWHITTIGRSLGSSASRSGTRAIGTCVAHVEQDETLARVAHPLEVDNRDLF